MLAWSVLAVPSPCTAFYGPTLSSFTGYMCFYGLHLQLKRDLLEYQSMVERQDDVLQVQMGYMCTRMGLRAEGCVCVQVGHHLGGSRFPFDQPISFLLGLTDPPFRPTQRV